ncbi:MAG: DUF4065 domain-containing protein [Flavobacterium sp.]|nr:DUF4065 domain-containing protein [Flavobacterium sp.]
MTYTASTIALKFVKLGIEYELPVTQMKLQKMLYFAQGIHLVLNDRKPLFEESFQAWKYGPVIPQIYHQYKFYGSQPILDTELLIIFNNNEAIIENLDTAAKKTIEFTWENTKDIDAIRLSNWTHNSGSPWSKHYVPGATDLVIPNEEIADYFSRFLVKQEN